MNLKNFCEIILGKAFKYVFAVPDKVYLSGRDKLYLLLYLYTVFIYYCIYVELSCKEKGNHIPPGSTLGQKNLRSPLSTGLWFRQLFPNEPAHSKMAPE